MDELFEIADKVAVILNTPNLECAETPILLEALDFYATRNVDFIDAYHAFLLQRKGPSRIATWDRKHFQRADWLEIVEL
jgi:predicted nucleic acid-binding protein